MNENGHPFGGSSLINVDRNTPSSITYKMEFIEFRGYYKGTRVQTSLEVDIYYPLIEGAKSQRIKIFHEGGKIFVNRDFQQNANEWNTLGVFLMSGDSTIIMDNDDGSSGIIIADAFRLTRIFGYFLTRSRSYDDKHIWDDKHNGSFRIFQRK